MRRQNICYVHVPLSLCKQIINKKKRKVEIKTELTSFLLTDSILRTVAWYKHILYTLTNQGLTRRLQQSQEQSDIGTLHHRSMAQTIGL